MPINRENKPEFHRAQRNYVEVTRELGVITVVGLI